ncbi:transcription-repair coupling factor (superfamily II helicase) [Dysgonomonas macrotermitis]|uniref:Transcription-repair-coupling factor n=2 Tax=Dysgonomonas macrotermitis TaxID=1346286 RepID=A0A1M5B251_9BACT|nr:transcription-repair coupling factor (superfamily II helicase) [Dysgonomonas macrotermitis]
MDSTTLLRIIDEKNKSNVSDQVLSKHKIVQIKGLLGSSWAMFAASNFLRSSQTYLYILDDAETAGYFYHDLNQLLKSKQVLFFPSAYKRAIKFGQIDSANEILRTEVLSQLQIENNPLLIVSYPEAVAEKVISKKTLKENTLQLKVSEKVDSVFVSKILESYGFEYTEYVYEPGQYAVRGSILDVFSYSCEYPYRIDFFGDEVESIRLFDIENQLSKEQLKQIQIIPQISKTDQLQESILNLLPDNSYIGYRDLSWIQGRINFIYNDLPVLDNSEYVKDVQARLITEATFTEEAEKLKQLIFSSSTTLVPEATIEYHTALQPIYHKNFDLVSKSLEEFMDQGYTIYILSDSQKQTDRLKTIFEDRGEKIPFIPVLHTLHEGFSDEKAKVCCFTDHQIFDRFHKYNLKSENARHGKIALSLKELNQLQVGDFIVHNDHGVGKFGGLVRMDMGGKLQEHIKLTYLNGDAIFVPIHSIYKISKYRGREGEPPRLNKLGSGAWQRMKDNTKRRLKDIARDLIKLYSKRREEVGFKFSPDSFMQTELEASFIYEDTPDQITSTADVKKDMESDRPMDRLICGDVGFGKTEVAIRAAFKAVADNKQVAVLVPTTVLATQHFHTFKDRLKDFPCKIDYISRARKTSDVKRILQELKEGKINILIGTHRIVAKDVQFHDLGLLIIDEEQKFGVSVKEKLKQMRLNVDTLTMTATPIPRTLQFSLMGARDLSTITTPPPNRYPTHTELHTFDPEIIREAINFEMSRNGQVFFINNRISNLPEIEKVIRRQVPDARIAVAHGQIDPQKLEQIITDFVDYEYDVLIATSIVESGIDIPNANTIIVNNAQQFGLSDLHQLRGRVGRGNKKAFCYLLAPPLDTLTPEAKRRLQAIENFSELGSGIHIAMQDLDIRGAGNLLGAEQSGFIADLGYEAYQKILTEAVSELRNEEFAELYHEQKEGEKTTGDNFVEDVVIDTDLELLFPPIYIPNDSERISIYSELNKLEKEADVTKFISMLEDRFGKIPPEGQELIGVIGIRRIAKALSIEKVTLKKGQMALYLVSNPDSLYYQSKAFDKLLTYIQKHPRECQLRETQGKRSILIKHIENVDKAYNILNDIAQQ